MIKKCGNLNLFTRKVNFTFCTSVEPKVESPPTASLADSLVKTTPADSIASQDATSLVNLLSKVDVSPADLISALSKVQGQSSFDGENYVLYIFWGLETES